MFYRDDGQQTYPGSIWAWQPRKESVPSQQLIVNRFLKACDRVNCYSRQPHHPQSPSCNSSGSTRLKTKPQRSVWQWDAKMYLHSKPGAGNPPSACLSCKIKWHKRERHWISSISLECINCCRHNDTIKYGNLSQRLNSIGLRKYNKDYQFHPQKPYYRNYPKQIGGYLRDQMSMPRGRKAGRCPEGTSHDPLALGNVETLQLEQELGGAK